MRWFAVSAAAALPLALLAGCPPSAPAPAVPGGEEARVVLYCAHDREFAEPILDAFTRETGIRVDAKWDTEAAKTTGLAQALRAEKEHPRADVFWSNEAAQAAALVRDGLAEPGTKAFAARARVILVHERIVPEGDRPRSIEDLTKARWKGRAAVANPLFGTTAAHLAALVSVWGVEKTRAWLRALKANDVAVCAGNGDVKNRVASGELAFGLTDSDDANVARLDGKPVVAVFPDQGEGALGTLVIPNVLSVVKGAPRPGNARKLVSFVASPKVEDELAKGRAAQIPLLQGATARPGWIPKDLRATAVDWDKVAAALAPARDLARQELLLP